MTKFKFDGTDWSINENEDGFVALEIEAKTGKIKIGKIEIDIAGLDSQFRVSVIKNEE